MRPLGVGIVGFGEIAQFHVRHLTAAGARVIGAVSSRELPRGIVSYPTLTAMLPHVDGVTIAVPNHLHARLCAEAVRADKPVFVEKPLCLTEDELSALEPLLAGATVPVHVGFRLRWNPALRGLRDRLRDARAVCCTYRLGIERLAAGKVWTRRVEVSGGAFTTLGVHALDLTRWLAGAAGQPLAALAATESDRDSSADFPLVASMQGTLDGRIDLRAAADLRGDAAFQLDLRVEAAAGRYPDRALPQPGPEDEGAADAEYGAMMAAFVRAAQSGGLDRAALAEALQVHRDLLRARRLAGSRPSRADA